MDPVINHLIQLQELSLIREEQKVAPGPTHLEELDASIRSMTEILPAPVRSMFERLQKRGPVVVVPVTEGICAGCGMGLPISLIQAVRHAREIQTCPNCARMLYYPEFRVRRLGRPPRRVEQRKVGISRFSSHALMVPRLQAATKEESMANARERAASASLPRPTSA